METSHEQSVEAVDFKSSIRQDSTEKDSVFSCAWSSLRVQFFTFIADLIVFLSYDHLFFFFLQAMTSSAFAPEIIIIIIIPQCYMMISFHFNFFESCVYCDWKLTLFKECCMTFLMKPAKDFWAKLLVLIGKKRHWREEKNLCSFVFIFSHE